MKPLLFLVSLAATLCPAVLNAGEACGPHRIAFTFDDAPTADTVVMTGAERTQRIIDALFDGGVEGAMFFSVSSRIDESSVTRMHDYADAGHVITSHTHTHPNLHSVGSDAFMADVIAAHGVLSELPGFQPYFRFPYLNEGSTEKERDAVRASLESLGYRPGYVTIDNFDFFIDRLLREAWEKNDQINLQAIGQLYVDMILGAAYHYDTIACQWLGRSPAHVLLLHENDVAALFLPALITAFRSAGWKTIPTIEAYADPIAKVVPDTLFLGQGQVAALAKLAGAQEADLRHEGENTDVLRAAFVAALQQED